jgi:type VI secretion system protein ImpM
VAGFCAFGKMPSMGDFLRINAPRSFVEPWDIWMQTGIQEVRRVLGNSWTACYMSAPIWRFTLSAGLTGSETMFGVVMPSVDRVGREFPLTLASPVTTPASLLDFHFSAENTFDTLEDVALKALEDETNRDVLSRLLSQITLRVVPPAPNLHKGIASQLRGMRQPSIWTAELESGPLEMVCDGLPNAVQMRALFDLDAPIWQANPQSIESSG